MDCNNYLSICVFAVCLDSIYADICYKYSVSYGSYFSYCSGYCTGSDGFETCNYYYYFYYYYTYSLSNSAIVGIVIGCLVFFGVFITVIVAVCSACAKRAGQTGRIIHPTQGVTTIAYSNGYQNSSMENQPRIAPGYNEPSHPPPNYQANNQSNLVASVPPTEHQGHNYR